MRDEPLLPAELAARHVTCLWDLDQLLGEVGWDGVALEIVFKISRWAAEQNLVCEGKDAARALKLAGCEEPEFIISIARAK